MELKIKCVNTTTSSDGSQYGKFVIEPLEKGFGTTIGNSLRRVLLSSLEGTAVTAVRIEGITHEYTAIPGVLEDVIDVMLNLKGLVVKTDSKEPQTLRIDVDRPGAVLASDIQLPAGVKVVNPDWLICTVAEGGSFHADIIVERSSEKSIVIGKRGQMIGEIRRMSQREIERFTGKQCDLELFVKVEKDWRDSSSRLKEYGYN